MNVAVVVVGDVVVGATVSDGWDCGVSVSTGWKNLQDEVPPLVVMMLMA